MCVCVCVRARARVHVRVRVRVRVCGSKKWRFEGGICAVRTRCHC